MTSDKWPKKLPLHYDNNSSVENIQKYSQKQVPAYELRVHGNF